jgi:ribosomal protein S18 acetylase RimI-like enzyme
MTALAPMQDQHYERFRSEAAEGYAKDNVLSLRWLAKDAQERSLSEFDRLLPQGISTPGHYLYEILDAPAGRTVGFLWFATAESTEGRAGYIYNIRVNPEFRGRGHARAAMELVEAMARSLDVKVISLHVFALNSTAQALYRAVGFGITGFNMLKRLDGGA